MTIAATCASLALAALLQGGDSGPYTDSKGRVWETLPAVTDYPDAATFDALFATEVFTNRHGFSFQIDRPLTPDEIAANASAGAFYGYFAPRQGPGGSIRASVRTHHPVDEEFRALFSTMAALRTYVIGIVESADDALESNWGINLIPSTGYRWDSNDSASIEQLLDEAYSEGGGLNGQCMMIAYSADPTPGGAIGVAYLGLPRALVKKYISQTNEAAITQHEVGHTYTLYHCCDGNCIMQAYLDVGAFGKFHNYVESCSGQNHYATMSNQKNRYCP